MWGKMDPYVVINYNGNKYRTRVHGEGGQTPVWNQFFDIPLNSDVTEINFAVYDEDILEDDEIGKTTISTVSIYSQNQQPKCMILPVY